MISHGEPPGARADEDARIENGEHLSVVRDTRRDVDLGDGGRSGKLPVPPSFVGHDVTGPQSPVGADELGGNLARIDQPDQIGPADPEQISCFLGGELPVIADETHRRTRGKVCEQVAHSRASARRELDVAAGGAQGRGPAIVRRPDCGGEALAVCSTNLERCDITHEAPCSPNRHKQNNRLYRG